MVDFAALSPSGLDEVVFAGLMAASFISSLITAALGIGGGALLLAIMASLVPPAALIPVHGVVQFASNAGRMALLRQSVHWPALRGFVVGALLGCALGGGIAVSLPPWIVQLTIGVFVIWSVLARPPAWLSRWPSFTGAASSFLTMFFGATGLFVAAYTKSHGLPRHGHVATHAALMTVQHGLKVVFFGAFGFAFGAWLWVAIALSLAGLGGTLVGKALLGRISDQTFRRALDILLICISLRLIYAALDEVLF